MKINAEQYRQIIENFTVAASVSKERQQVLFEKLQAIEQGQGVLCERLDALCEKIDKWELRISDLGRSLDILAKRQPGKPKPRRRK